jgi:hypothetical protein
MITILILSFIATALMLFKFCTALFFKNKQFNSNFANTLSVPDFKYFYYHILVLSFLLLIAFLSIFCLAVLYVKNDEPTVRRKIRLFGNDYAKKIMNFINNLSLVIVLILMVNIILVLIILNDEETMLYLLGNFGVYFLVSLAFSMVILILSPTNTDDPHDSTSTLPPAVSDSIINSVLSMSTLLPR